MERNLSRVEKRTLVGCLLSAPFQRIHIFKINPCPLKEGTIINIISSDSWMGQSKEGPLQWTQAGTGLERNRLSSSANTLCWKVPFRLISQQLPIPHHGSHQSCHQYSIYFITLSQHTSTLFMGNPSLIFLFLAEMSFLIFLDEFEIHWATFSELIGGKFTLEILSLSTQNYDVYLHLFKRPFTSLVRPQFSLKKQTSPLAYSKKKKRKPVLIPVIKSKLKILTCQK